MLDRIFNSTGAAFGFIFFVVVLFAFYMVNRERAQVKRLKGPRRFQPKWKSQRQGRRRRRRRGGGFKPDWSPREGARPGRGEQAEGTDAAPETDEERGRTRPRDSRRG